MTVDIYNQQNNKVDKMELPDNIFNIKWNPDLVWQTAMVMNANRRQILAHTKGRGEVKGGGKKPWRQKGTGRARAGSIRSPLWKGGGVTFGPTKERNFKRKISKKMKHLALFSLISKKIKDSELKIVNSLDINSFKTKEAIKIINAMFPEKKGLVLVSQKDNLNLKRAFRNIEKVKYLPVNMLNVLDLLNHKYILIEKEAVRDLAEKSV